MQLLIAVTSALLLFCTAAVAHTHLESSTPTENSVLASSPAQIVLRFSEPTRVTALMLQREGDKEERSVMGFPKTASTEVNAPLAPLPTGK
jgi:hypothetical protein